jgi:Ca2+-binding EF-hand superfamily protein
MTARKIVNSIDANKDGRIDYAEFKTAIFKGIAKEKDEVMR